MASAKVREPRHADPAIADAVPRFQHLPIRTPKFHHSPHESELGQLWCQWHGKYIMNLTALLKLRYEMSKCTATVCMAYL